MKKRIVSIMMVMMLLCTAFELSENEVQAVSKGKQAEKASYKIETKRDKYLGKLASATYYYDLPQLKGKTTVIKKINNSLKNSYLSTLNLKKEIFSEAKKYDKFGGYEKGFVYENNVREAYNQKGYISFMFFGRWGEDYNYNWKTNIWGETYNLKTGKKLTIADALSLSNSKAKNKIANEYVKKYNCLHQAKVKKEIKGIDIKKIQFFCIEIKYR